MSGPSLAPRSTATLTQAELGLWYAQRVDPSNPVFNTGQYVDLRGPLDRHAFRRAIEQAIAEADTLAFRVAEMADGPSRVIDPLARPALQDIDLDETRDPEAESLTLMRRDMASPVAPDRDALAATVLFRLSEDWHRWYLRIHHIAIDGYGTALLVRRVRDLYRAAVTGTAPETPPFAPLADVIDDEATYLTSPKVAADRQFWLDQFADRPEPASLAPRADLTTHTYLTHSAHLTADTNAAVTDLARRSGVVWPDLLVALTAAYIERHTGGGEAIVGVATMERLGRPAARVPAMVMNILPARVAIDDHADLTAWLSTTARHLQRLRRHGRYRGEQLRRDLGLSGAQRRLHGPLINVLPFDDALEWPGLEATLHLLGTGPVDDLTVTWRADGVGAGLRLELDGNPRLYSAADLETHAARLTGFIARAATAATLAAVPTMDVAETRRWTAEVNNTAHDVPDVTLTTLIIARMQATPSAPALRFEGVTWTYAELDERTAALARRLVGRGIGRGDIVGVMAPRSFELVVALIAVLRAGAAYMPIDPSWPAGRVAQTLETSRATLVLTHGTFDTLPASTPTLELMTVDPHDAPVAPIDQAVPTDAAYVIFTSGSTGAPKGAVIEHRAIVNRLEWMREFYGFTPADRLLQKTPATFDVSVWEFFLAFTTGARLVVAPPEAHRDPAWLARIIREEAITTVHFVPSMLAVFLEEPSVAGLAMRRVFCSGEELPASLRDRFHAVMQAELHNLYGPTEAAVDVTWWDASRGDRSEPVPIGFPVWNTQMYVLDHLLRPVPSGVVGDLYIAGVQLARGYLNRPDLTEERFVPNPLGPRGSRMYKTGDLARWGAYGALTFLGRSDFQVKIRGFRIELGEIEAVLAATGLLRQVAVVAREDRPGDRQLVAYVVGRDPAVDVDIAALRDATARRLPDYMVPAAFVVLDDLPLSANGKLQRSSLPAPARTGSAVVSAPRTPTETALHAMFADVLDLDPAGDEAAAFGRDDDFFVLGGHSLLAAQLMARVRQRWNIDATLGMVFAYPTLARLADRIDALTAGIVSETTRLGDLGFGPVIQLAAAPDPTHAPTPLFCIHPAGGLGWSYSLLARSLAPGRAVYGLQARGLDVQQDLPVSLEAMAVDYVARMREVQPAGPYALAGWSVGGLLAHAMAVELRRLGQDVSLLALVDAYPADRYRDEAPPDESLALRALLLVAGHDPTAIPGRLTREGVIAFLEAAGHPLGTLSDESLEAIMRVVTHNSQLVRAHRHEIFDGDVLYFRAALDHAGTTLSPLDWRPYVTGAIEVHAVASMHAHLMGPSAVGTIATVLNEPARQHNRGWW